LEVQEHKVPRVSSVQLAYREILVPQDRRVQMETSVLLDQLVSRVFLEQRDLKALQDFPVSRELLETLVSLAPQDHQDK